MNCLPWIFFWLAGLPSQKWVCPSMTKISSPLAVLYMAFLLLPLGLSVMRLAAVVHRDSALVRNRILERDVFHRFEDVVVLLQHICLLKGLVKGRWVGL